ncbi:MAG: hypothetical protein WCC48_13220, partial [Anaeromyxobacteraceae bacterium]
MTWRPGTRGPPAGPICVTAMLAALGACAPVTRGLKADLAAGSYERVIQDGRLWLSENAVAAKGEKAQLASEVARLVAEAELGQARRADQPGALRAYRARYEGWRGYADLVAAARAANAEVEFRKEVAASASIERLRAFRAEFPGTPEAAKARALEVGLAEAAAREAATVESERAFRDSYSEWQEAGPAIARSRAREVPLALEAAKGDEQRLVAFQAEYRGWPEATEALASARAAEAALALAAAGDDVE